MEIDTNIISAHSTISGPMANVYLVLESVHTCFDDGCDGCDGRALFGREGCDSCDGCDGRMNDCACASVQPSSQARVPADDVVREKLLQTLPGLQFAGHSPEYEIIYSPQAASQVAVITPGARSVLDFFNSPNTLQHWPASANLLAEEAASACDLLYAGGFLVEAGKILQPPAPARKPAALEAWLYLTRDCNLRCAHCYVQKDTRRMSEATGKKAIRQLFHLAQRDGFRIVKIKYAGGEPTLRWGFVQRLHAYAQLLALESGLGLREILVTNGVSLSLARLRYLQESKIKLSISLDGFGSGQDQQRPMLNGAGSFDRVIHNIEQALILGLRPALTITLTALNLGDLPQVMRFALKNGLHLNLNFYRPVSSADPLTASPADLVKALRETIRVIEADLPVERVIDTLIDRSNFGISHQHTCGAGRNYMSVDTDGSVLPCHMLHGANDLRLVRSLDEARSSVPGFENPAIDERPGCQGCQWKNWCTGGCPILAGNLRGAASASSPYCAVYKAIYPELIRLEGARLLKLGQMAAAA